MLVADNVVIKGSLPNRKTYITANACLIAVHDSRYCRGGINAPRRHLIRTPDRKKQIHKHGQKIKNFKENDNKQIEENTPNVEEKENYNIPESEKEQIIEEIKENVGATGDNALNEVKQG